MELENTIENKAKFFALYLGQEVRIWVDVETQHSYELNFMSLNYLEVGKFKLLLKSLRNITDADAIEVAKVCYPLEDLPKLEMNIKNVGLGIVSSVNEMGFIPIDYLRSKGYFLPYLGMDEEEATKRCWIKIINQ